LQREPKEQEVHSLPTTPPLDCLLQRHSSATHSNSSGLSCPYSHRPAPPQWEKWVPTSLEAQPSTCQSVWTPNVNSSSLNNLFSVVVTVFQ
jgi:hypothetical protein